MDEEEQHPLQKILAKLRSGASVGPVIPVLPVKAKKVVLEEEEEDEEEEAVPRPQKKKKGGKSAEVAVVEESGVDPQLVALIGEVKSLASAVVGRLHEPVINPERRANFSGRSGNFTGGIAGRGGGRRNFTGGLARHRNHRFTSAGRCMQFHDDEACTFRTCSRAHGKGGSGMRCQHAGSGMCEAFYTQQGCPKSHRR